MRRVDYTNPNVEPYWDTEGDVVADIRRTVEEQQERES